MSVLPLCLLGLAGCATLDGIMDALGKAGVVATDPTTGALVAAASGGSAAPLVTGLGALAVSLTSAYFALTGRKRPGATEAPRDAP